MHHPRGVWKLLSRFVLALVMAIAASHASAGAGISSGSWTSIGPSNFPGRVTTIAIHPTQPNKMWVGTGNGGIWKSTDSGANWAKVDDFLPSLVITSIVLAPGNPDLMYAGTGELTTNLYDFWDFREPQRGAGMLRSTDGGATWAVLPSTAPAGNADWQYVQALAVHPSNANILIAAASGGLYRSTNAGGNWAPVLAQAVRSIQFDPNDGNKVVVGAATPWYSIDAGATWTQGAGFTASPKTAGATIAYSRQPGVVYAASEWTSTCCTLGGRVHRSADGGATWTPTTEPGHLGSRFPVSQALWVDPLNANHVIVGGADLHRSLDGGATWAPISQGGQAGSVPSGQHAIVSAPGYNGSSNRTIYFGTAAGLYRAVDIQAVTATNVGWSALNAGLATTELYGGDGHVGIARVVAGGRTGSYVYPGSGSTWTSFLTGEGGPVAMDRQNANVIYGTVPKLRVYRSTDGGASVTHISTNLPQQRANVAPPLWLDYNNREVLWVGGVGLWGTGEALTSSSPPWGNNRPISFTDQTAFTETIGAIGGFDSCCSCCGWIGTNGGRIFKHVTATNSWVRKGEATLPAGMVKSIVDDTGHLDKVFVSFAPPAAATPLGAYQSLWRTLDAGATWSHTSTGLTRIVRTITKHPNTHEMLYAGTDLGIYTSTDAGVTWSPVNDGPANVRVDQLFWIGHTLYAATHGRGMFRTTNPLPASGNLAVTKAGAGSGPVTSTPGGISCGSTCDANYGPGVTVTLTATPNSGSVFSGWSGACTGTSACVVTIDGNKRVTATFSISGGRVLTVQKAGTGSGPVTSNPSGISCGTTCAWEFSSGTLVTLTASANPGSVFAGWSGACTGSAATCNVTMDLAKTVTATFNKAGHPLTVSKAGDGSGPVSSSPAGIACGSSCSASFGTGTTVTLTATPNAGSVFAGWSGACSGTSACTVVMDAPRNVTATFTRTPVLTVSKSGTGSGPVSSAPSGISCGSQCQASFALGASVALTATPNSGSFFAGWSGACNGSSSTCLLTMDGAKAVTATFSAGFALSISKAGSGSGPVTSNPSGIACGSTCTRNFAPGTNVTLTATANSGSAFAGWSGACSGMSNTCVVSMDAAKNVTATFTQTSGAAR
jgi:hypothetical protein